MQALLERIKACVGPAGWFDGPDDTAPYLAEMRGLYQGKTALVVRPASTEQVSEIVRLTAEAQVPLIPQGGNTGLVGGTAAPSDGRNILLSLTRMNRVRALDPENFTLTVDAGAVLAEVQTIADGIDRFFPISLGAEGSCTIGGNIATNAGGIQVLHYGSMRDQVLGLEVVLADGRVWHGLRGLRKDNTGYDLKQLFIGSEGTLGIITAATLKLYPKPRVRATALVGLKSYADCLTLFNRVRIASGDQLTAFEVMPRIGLDLAFRHIPGLIDPLAAPHPVYALIEGSSSRADADLNDALATVLGAAAGDGLIQDATLAATLTQTKALWRLREALVEAQRFAGGSIKHDIAVPVSSVPAFLDVAFAAVAAAIPGVRPIAFGHLGDGNIHFNLTQPEGADKTAFLARWDEINRLVHDIVIRFDGTISAEHGIGRLKRGELARLKDPLDLDLMRRIKAAFDPTYHLNPGVLFPCDAPQRTA